MRSQSGVLIGFAILSAPSQTKPGPSDARSDAAPTVTTNATSSVLSAAEPESSAAGVAIGAIDQLLRDVDQRPKLRRLGLVDDAAIDQLVTDTLDDVTIQIRSDMGLRDG